MDEGAGAGILLSEARPWSDTQGKIWQQSSFLGNGGVGGWGWGDYQLQSNQLSPWLIGYQAYQGNQQRGMPFTAPSTRTVTGWGWGKCVFGSVVSVGHG